MKPAKPARILVVEDDHDTSHLLLQSLEAEGYQVIQAFDGIEGEKALIEQRPDLVLLDIMMPKLDGFELCRRARENPATRTLPILFLTAKDDFTDKMKGFRSGGDDYVTKPFVVGELMARISAHLRIQTLKRDLAFSEQRYRLLIENSPDAILLVSPDRELLFHNHRLLEILKQPVEQNWSGKSLAELRPLSDLFELIGQILERIEANPHPVRQETRISVSNQRTVFLELMAAPILDDQSRVEMCQVALRDITERRRMEEALIQAEKINSLGILTAGIAHEVNNPLTGISNAIQLVKSTNLEGKKKEDLCDLVLNHIQRIARIVKDLHIFSKPQGGAPQVFSVKEAIDETLSLARYQVRGGRITFAWEPPTVELALFGDKNQFQQVLINLLVNAIHAIEKEGKITIVAERRGQDAVIAIEDTGCGIPPHQLGRIFDPFFTTKRDWKGTGLGLAVSFRIIQLFKGSLAVQSTVGVGSRFTITVPLHQRPS